MHIEHCKPAVDQKLGSIIVNWLNLGEEVIGAKVETPGYGCCNTLDTMGQCAL